MMLYYRPQVKHILDLFIAFSNESLVFALILLHTAEYIAQFFRHSVLDMTYSGFLFRFLKTIMSFLLFYFAEKSLTCAHIEQFAWN